MSTLGRALFIWSSAIPFAALAQTATPTANTLVSPSAPVSAAAPQPTAAVISPVAADSTILRAGASVPLRFMEELTTKGKKIRVGQRVQLEVAENVMLGTSVIIPAGAPAIGEVTDVRNKGMWGKSGKLNIRALYARVNGRQIRLTGQIDDKGVAGGVGATAVSAIVFLPAGFFMTGTSAKIPMGAPMVAFLDEDIQIAYAPSLAVVAPSTPMVVQVPATSPPPPMPK